MHQYTFCLTLAILKKSLSFFSARFKRDYFTRRENQFFLVLFYTITKAEKPVHPGSDHSEPFFHTIPEIVHLLLHRRCHFMRGKYGYTLARPKSLTILEHQNPSIDFSELQKTLPINVYVTLKLQKVRSGASTFHCIIVLL